MLLQFNSRLHMFSGITPSNKLSFNKATELYFDKYDISYDCILRYKAEYLQLKLEEIENLMHQLKQDQPHQKEPLRIGVGVGVMVFKNNQVLLGRRLGSHGEGEYAFPGGHLDHLESIEKCAQREVMEETGMKIKNIKFLRLYNLKEYAPKHYIDIGMTAEWESGNPKLLEPNKCEGWNWYDLDNLPQPLFATTETYLDAIKNGKNFYDQ